jgi:diguanylate cyclase
MGYEGFRLQPGPGRIRRLFGLSMLENHLDDDPPSLIAQISAFLIDNDLEASPANLLRAHALFSGSNPRFARKVAEREALGEAITQQWLDEADKPVEPEHNPAEELHKLAADLDRSIHHFGQATSTARVAASTYTDELARHVATVGSLQHSEAVLVSLAQIAKVMLERTREVEQAMAKSDREVETLRRSLVKARREAGVDHLTGLPNRRAFEEVFGQERREAQEMLEPLYLSLIDIDFFKAVNDTHGHETGDRVIRAVGQALNRISDHCHVARHGGEEFVLLFRGLDPGRVFEQIDSARERMAARRFVDRMTGKPIGEVTFSAGLIDVFAYHDMGEALRAADEALYRAKQGGRNRIEVG